MARVLPKVFCAVDNVALAAKVVDSVGDALGIDVLLGARTEILRRLHAYGCLDTVFKHFSGLLAELRVLIVVGLKILFPCSFDEGRHTFIIV